MIVPIVVAAVILVIGLGVLAFRFRTEKGIESGISSFQRELHALAPRSEPKAARRSTPPTASRPAADDAEHPDEPGDESGAATDDPTDDPTDDWADEPADATADEPGDATGDDPLDADDVRSDETPTAHDDPGPEDGGTTARDT